MSNIDKAVKSPPRISFHMECYHYETRTETDSKGNTRTRREKVVTHTAHKNMSAGTWRDESAPISSLFYLQAMMMTRLHSN